MIHLSEESKDGWFFWNIGKGKQWPIMVYSGPPQYNLLAWSIQHNSMLVNQAVFKMIFNENKAKKCLVLWAVDLQ